MNKKREIIMDSHPERISPRVSIPDDPAELDAPELDMNDIDLRDAEIEALTAQYVLALMNLENVSAEDIGFDQDMLTAIVDEVELVLSDHGITIYRPTIIEDEDGNERIVSSVFGEDA